MVGTMELIFVAGGFSVIALIAALFVFQVRHRRQRGAPARACGHCGYDVRGLPTFICPECGSDLRDVGIVRGAAPNALFLLFTAIASGWVRLLLATFAIGALLVAIGYGAMTFILPHEVYPLSEVVLEPPSKPGRIMVTMTGRTQRVAGRMRGRADQVVGQTVSIVVAPPGGVFDYNRNLHIDLGTWSSVLHHWLAGRAPHQDPVRFERDELARLFRESKLTAMPTDDELNALMRFIDGCKSGMAHRIAASAAPLAVLSAADKTQVSYAGAFPLGPPLLAGGLSLWLLTMTGMIIARMYRLRDGAPTRSAMEPAASPAPASPPVARTLSVLFSDIKDFTAHSAAATRTGAIELAHRHRELAAPIIQQRRGVIVKTIGDGLLVTFESATDAALAGLDIQSTLTMQNAAAGSEPFQLRIAIATGEVVVEAGDVYGDTVNLASRLQSIAEPGRVVLSAATAALINAREVQAEPCGEFRLAGLAAVQAFVARPRLVSGPTQVAQ